MKSLILAFAIFISIAFAANTSPNLDEEERAHLMSITPGE